MKKIDYLLQSERIRQAGKYIHGKTLFDIGCHDGEIFQKLSKKGISGEGIDDVIKEITRGPNFTQYPGYFPHDFPIQRKYDNITLLAVMEHIPIEQLVKYPELLLQYLQPKGRVIVTVPAKSVDHILKVLLFFKLIDGMDLAHHQNFERSLIKKLFSENGYKVIAEKKFEFGLNQLYVFERP